MLRIQHCLDSRLTDGGKVVSPTYRQRSTPHKRYSLPGHGSVVVKALCYKPEGREFETGGRELIFSIYLILPAALALRFIQPLTEMSTRSRKMFLESTERPVRRAANFTAICEPIVYTMWDPQLHTLWDSKACYGDSFSIWRRSVLLVRYELDCKYCYK
jgi:hypothetical protein